jgi:thiol-disulfide isomerase/thioredoxin
VLLVVATGAVAFLTRTPSEASLPAGAASAHVDLSWTPVATRSQLVSEVARARREGKAVVVDVWAKWCTYCKRYDRVIEDSPALRTAFGAMHRLRIHVDDDDQVALREGSTSPRHQPFPCSSTRQAASSAPTSTVGSTTSPSQRSPRRPWAPADPTQVAGVGRGTRDLPKAALPENVSAARGTAHRRTGASRAHGLLRVREG